MAELSQTDKPKLKIKMQSVSDDDVRKTILAKPCFELAAKGVFRLGRCYIFWQGIGSLGQHLGRHRWLPTVDCLTGGTRKTIGACRTK